MQQTGLHIYCALAVSDRTGAFPPNYISPLLRLDSRPLSFYHVTLKIRAPRILQAVPKGARSNGMYLGVLDSRTPTTPRHAVLPFLLSTRRRRGQHLCRPLKWQLAFGAALDVAVDRNISNTIHALPSRGHAESVWLAANLAADLAAFIMKRNDPRPVAIIGVFLGDNAKTQYALLGTDAQRPLSESSCLYIFIRFPDLGDEKAVRFQAIRSHNATHLSGSFETQLNHFGPTANQFQIPPQITINNYGRPGLDNAVSGPNDEPDVPNVSAHVRRREGQVVCVPRGIFCCLVQCSLQFWWIGAILIAAIAVGVAAQWLLSSALVALPFGIGVGLAGIPGIGWAMAQAMPAPAVEEPVHPSYSIPHVPRKSLPAVASFGETTLERARLSLEKVRLGHKDYVDDSLSLQDIFNEMHTFKTFRTGAVTLDDVVVMLEQRQAKITEQFRNLVTIEKDLKNWNVTRSENSPINMVLSLLSYQRTRTAHAHNELHLVSQRMHREISQAIRDLDGARITFTDLFYLFEDIHREVTEKYRPKVAEAASDFQSSAERLEKDDAIKAAAEEAETAAKATQRGLWSRIFEQKPAATHQNPSAPGDDHAAVSGPRAPSTQELDERLRTSSDRLRKGEQSLRDADATLSLVAFFTKKTSITTSLTSQTYEREREELLKLEKTAEHIREFLSDRSKDLTMEQLAKRYQELENLRNEMWDCVRRYNVIKNQ